MFFFLYVALIDQQFHLIQDCGLVQLHNARNSVRLGTIPNYRMLLGTFAMSLKLTPKITFFRPPIGITPFTTIEKLQSVKS